MPGPSRFLHPRRFAEVFQMNQEFPGSLVQQQMVRYTMKVEYESPQHYLLKRLDASANQVYGRPYLLISFLPDDMWPPNMLAVAGVAGVSMREGLSPGGIANILPHELGHVVSKHRLLSPADKEWFMHKISGEDLGDNNWPQHYEETWADAFGNWWNGTGWEELTGILTSFPDRPL